MAVKFRTPTGATDLLGQTSPRFPVRDPEAFVQLTEASAKPYLIPLFLARHPSAAPAVFANLRSKTLAAPYSYAEVTYYPIHAYGWLAGDGARSWVRYVLTPLATRDDRLAAKFEGRDRLAEEMTARLDRGPVRFDLRVTVAGDGDDPHDPMSVWKGARGAQRRDRRGHLGRSRPRGRRWCGRWSSTRSASSTGSRCRRTRSCCTGRTPTRRRCPAARSRP